MNEKEEKIHMEAQAQVFKDMIIYCQSQLEGLGVELTNQEKFSAERVDIIKTLRSLCKDNGDTDWPDDLHISDILNKHFDFPEKFFLGSLRGDYVYVISTDNVEAAKEFAKEYKTIAEMARR